LSDDIKPTELPAEENVPAAPTAQEGLMSRRDLLRTGAMGVVGAAVGLAGLKNGIFGLGDQPAKETASSRWSFATTKPISLNIWIWAGQSVEQAGFDAVKAANPKDFGNVDLNFTVFNGGDQQCAEKFSLALSGHTTLPDLLTLNYIEVPEFAGTGVISNLNDVFKPVENGLYAGTKLTAQVNGQYVDIPQQLNAKLFYYRQDLFEGAGIDPATIPAMTQSEFIAMGKKFTAKYPGQYIMNMFNEPPEYLFDEFVSAWAPIAFADTKGKYDITSNPAFASTLAFMRQIRSSGIAYPVDDFTTDWPAAIKAEKINGFLIADWMDQFLPSYATTSAYGKWRAVPWPKLAPMANQQYGSDSGGAVKVFPTGARNNSLAIELANYWHLSETGSVAAFGANGVLPVVKTAEPAVLDSLKSMKKPASMSQTDWLELPQNYFGGLSYIQTKLAAQDRVTVFSFDPKALVDWETIMVNWMEKAVQGKSTVKAALEGMQHDMQSQVGNPWQSS
jgi:maltose-binding protein MalE